MHYVLWSQALSRSYHNWNKMLTILSLYLIIYLVMYAIVVSLFVRLSNLIWKPTMPPNETPCSFDTRFAHSFAATRLGCEHRTRHGSVRWEQYSNMYWGTCVVFPHPVGPDTITTWFFSMASRICCFAPNDGRDLSCVTWPISRGVRGGLKIVPLVLLFCMFVLYDKTLGWFCKMVCMPRMDSSDICKFISFIVLWILGFFRYVSASLSETNRSNSSSVINARWVKKKSK